MAKNGNGHSAYRRYRAYRKKRQDTRRIPRWVIAFAALVGLGIIGMGVGAGVVFGVYQTYATDLVPPDEYIAQLPRGGARIHDRDGKLLYEYSDLNYQRRDPVTLDQVSPKLVDATIVWEDSSFRDNPGVNFKGVAAAGWDNFSPFGESPGFLEGRGGSSITQQLVKNVYFTQEQREQRSVERKLKETVYALEITRNFSKDQILEWYLNLISYGNNLTGVQAAARGYFNVDAKDLNYAQAATLAVIPQNPTIYNPLDNPELVKQQRNLALLRMYEEGKIPGEWFLNAANQPLVVLTPRTPVIAPHFVFNIVEPQLIDLFGPEAYKRDGLIVTTSIDLEPAEQSPANPRREHPDVRVFRRT